MWESGETTSKVWHSVLVAKFHKDTATIERVQYRAASIVLGVFYFNSEHSFSME